MAAVDQEFAVARLDYAYWHKNPDNVIGLLCKAEEATTIPLRSIVRFVKRSGK